MLDKCSRGYWRRQDIYDDWTGEFEYNEVWVSSCNWQAITTFKDKCLTCGKLNHYTNTNGYPEESLLRDGQK